MWILDTDDVLPLWRPSRGDDHALAFSTRRGGISTAPFESLNLGRSTQDSTEAVTENRRRLLNAIGLDPEHLATAGQVHGIRVANVSEPGLCPQTDALVTTVPGLALAVTGADCLPLIYTAPGAVAVAHSGWRGTAGGMPTSALDALCLAAHVEPGEVAVHLGPSIRGCCYRVGPEVVEQFPPEPVAQRGDNWFLDLAEAARTQLLDRGVAAANLHVTPACTACDEHLYFSHRRDAGRTGRHWAVAALA